MLDWFGGGGNLLSALIPLLGICLVLAGGRVTGTNRAARYVLPAFGLWFGLRVLIGLEQGSLVSVPRFVGLSAGVSLLTCFLSLLCYGLYVLVTDRDPVASRA
jgi:hypothetical protein